MAAKVSNADAEIPLESLINSYTKMLETWMPKPKGPEESKPANCRYCYQNETGAYDKGNSVDSLHIRRGHVFCCIIFA
ncbi:17752_t:CDS:2, partial [Racocetra persica]